MVRKPAVFARRETKRGIRQHRQIPDSGWTGCVALGGNRFDQAGVVIDHLCDRRLRLNFNDVPPYRFCGLFALRRKVLPGFRLENALAASALSHSVIATFVGAGAPSIWKILPFKVPIE